MYNCLDCGAEFGYPVVDCDIEGKKVETCPDCGSDDIVEADDENDDSVYGYEYDDSEDTLLPDGDDDMWDPNYIILACVLFYAVLGVYCLCTARPPT